MPNRRSSVLDASHAPAEATIPAPHVLDFYATPAGITSPGKFSALVDELPSDPLSLIHAVPGLVIHEYLASNYGLTVPNERKSESHIRPVEQMLGHIVALDPSPLSDTRPPEKRLVGICRHFEVLLVTFLRGKQIPARIRRGFGTYFDPRMSVDHEITEYWNAEAAHWVRVDAQLDEVQRRVLQIDFDPLEVPTDRFIIPAVAWQDCRSGRADPKTFGIFEMSGLWFIASNLVREVAWLNKREMLPWDVWGAMPKPEQTLGEKDLVFFDRLAALTRDPDASFDELRTLYETDDRIRVPGRVFNATLNREETV